MTIEETERALRVYYCSHLRILKALLETATKAKDTKDFENSLNRSIILARKFNAYLRESAQYSEKAPRISPLEDLFNGLKSISKRDLVAAKIQAQFVENDIEEEYLSISKA